MDKPTYATLGNFPNEFQLMKSSKNLAARQGELLEANSEQQWEKAEVLEFKNNRIKVHFTKNTETKRDAWISPDRVRPFEYSKYLIA